MNLRISISPKNEKTAPQSDKQLKENVRNAAELICFAVEVSN